MKIKLLLLVSLFFINTSFAADELDLLKQKFIGDYELVSYFAFSEDGTKRDMSYIGRLSYDKFENMSGLGMPIDLPVRASHSSERTIGGFGYWGKVSWNPEDGTVTHHVEGSPMVPGWVGGDNVRYFEFLNDDLLTLSIKNNEDRVTGTLTWRRLK
jgi:hypothetical protein